MLRPGDTVAGHKLIDRLGGGRFGEVWRAEFEGRPVALKVFSPRRGVRREAVAQFELGRLSGDDARWFPRAEHVDLDASPAWLRMELVDSRTLDEAVDEPARTLDGRLDLAEQVLRALEVVHRRGFVHGDLSPRNVLVAGDRIRLIDVGLGRLAAPPADMTISDEGELSMGVAAPLYAAPERFGGSCGPAADIFSFGKLLYRLITRDPPHAVKPLTRKYPELGASWDDFIFRCLEEHPSMRFPDAGAALAEFSRLRGRPSPRAAWAKCPTCGAVIHMLRAIGGALLTCPNCRTSVEVVRVDEAAGWAECRCVACEPPKSRDTVRFCPRCGRMGRGDRRECGNCRVDVDDYARILRERDRRAHAPPVPARNFWPHALATMLGYLACWFPGALLNLHFLADSGVEEEQVGRTPPGRGALEFLSWTCLYLPLLLVVAIVLYGALRAMVH